MIIKSKSRKSATFEQLYDYINRYGGESFMVTRNFVDFEPDRDHIVGEFLRNSANLPSRRNGNILYHEILSLKRHSTVSLEAQKEILYDLATKYLELRADRLLAYGRVHEEAEHMHFHFIISANELGKPSRFRLPRADFNRVQREVELHLLTEYPEMEDKPLYNDARERRLGRKSRPQKDAEFQLKKRTGAPSKKDRLRETIKAALAAAATRPQLNERLAGEGITLEERGKSTVAVQGKTRTRLSSLELQDAYTLWNASQHEMDTRRDELTRLRAKKAEARAKEAEKDAEREVERKELVGANKMRPLSKIPERYFFGRGWKATFGHPVPEIDLLEVDHFIVNFDKFIDDKSCSLQEFHPRQCFAAIDENLGMFDYTEAFATRLADYNTMYCSLGGALDSRHGLRMAKLGERTYRLYFPDPAKQQAAWDDLKANRTVGELPVSVLGIYWENVCYQFRLKKPVSNEPKVGTFALDLNKYLGKTIGPELGNGLTLAEDKATKQTVIEASPSGVFQPANLAIKGDFTITAKMVFLRENAVFQLNTSKSRIELNQEADRFGNGFHFLLNKKMPSNVTEEKGITKTVIFKRTGDTLQVTSKGAVFDPIPLPRDEVVEEFSIGGFTVGMGLADFTITTP